jgi:photosystem II stability/assembly factor-like uncharacterized protein
MRYHLKTLLIIAILCSSAICHAQVWTQVFGPLGEDVEAIYADDSGRVFIGTDTAAFSTTDNGLTWQWDTAGLDAPDEFSFLELSNGMLFAGTELSGIFRSTDYGRVWKSANQGLPDSAFVSAIICDSSQGLFAALAIHGIYYSSDQGDHWALRSSGLPTGSINALTRAPNGDLYAGLTGYIARSTNQGGNWTLCDTLEPSFEVIALGADSTGDIFAGAFPGMILHSRDGGATWDTINPPQPLPAVRCIATSNGLLFVGTYGSGVWKSTDMGDHWSPIIDGITGDDLKVLCCTITKDSELFIGTLTASVFRTNIFDVSSVQPPVASNVETASSIELTKSGTLLHFALPSAQWVDGSVYDFAGRKLCELCSGLFIAGEHAISLENYQERYGACFIVLRTEDSRSIQLLPTQQ